MSSSSSYKQFAHLQIPLEEIQSATNNFSDENLIRRGRFGQAYRGKLLWRGEWIDIVARRLDTTYWKGKKEFWMEVSMLSTLKHDNLVSIVGFYYDQEGEKIIINKHETHGSLDKYLKDPTLTWMRRLEICVGIARAISYIHYDKERDFSVLHRNIKSSKILLDDKWKPKLSGFELSMKITAARRHRLFHDSPSGMLGCIDPRYVKTGGLTHKSDMYSFGVVLFEVMCGRRAFNHPYWFPLQLAKQHPKDESQDVLGKLDQIIEHEGHLFDASIEKYHSMEGFEYLDIPNEEFLAPVARVHYEERKLHDMIDPDLLKQMDPQSFQLFSEIAYCCIKEQRSTRPDIHQVIILLEKALDLQREHDENLNLKEYAEDEDASTNHLKKNFRHLEISLTDIEKATNNFDKAYLIGEGTYGEVYKAELDHFDNKDLLSLEEKNKDGFPKKRSTVAIKCIIIREDSQGEEGFYAEIEMLTRCKHPNIIPLLGFCQEGRHMILVYEHASNGSLDNYLGSSAKLTNLSWVQRIKICIDIARGLNYLHTKIEDDRRIIHRDIKSYNILLTENWEAKIADFGLSRFRPENQQPNKTLYTQTLAGTKLYFDPEYIKTGKLKNESDIYSFGVVLFEILSGRFANDAIYTEESRNGIAAVARRHFNEGTIRDMVDARLIEETHLNMFSPNKGPDQDSLYAFSTLAYQCVAESQAERPTAGVIVKKLEEALSFQENVKDQLKFSVEDIELATQNFSDINLIGEGGLGKVYKGEITHANGHNTPIAAKRLYKGRGQKSQYLMELQAVLEYKHENIINVVGYCNEMDERIIVYEYASRGGLDKHLNDDGLTWMKRLKISIDVACGLHFLHGGGRTQEMVIHRDIKSSNILIGDDWKAKISDFGLSLISPINKDDMDFVIDDAVGTPVYIDPLYAELGFLTKESDIYSFGVVLFDILCGRLISEFSNGDFCDLSSLIKSRYKEGTLDEMVFEGIKQQALQESLATFQAIAYQCLHSEREKRPTTSQVLLQLKKALELQEDYEIWEPKLPNDYKEIISEIYSTEKRKDLYHMFSKGILVQEAKVLFSLGSGERIVMISAKTFSYINHCLRKWRSVPESRFEVVAEMLDISNLKIKIKTRTQLLSPDVIYGVYVVFKFCDPRKVSSKPLYVNRKYKNGRKTSHAYFAKWRDNDWMMIELCRFLNDKKDIDFKFLLQSLSRYDCRDSTIYVEGIEFRPIENVKNEEINEIKEVQQVLKSNSNMDLIMQQLPMNPEEVYKGSENGDNGEKLFSLNEMNGKKYLTLSAKAAVYNYSVTPPNQGWRKRPRVEDFMCSIITTMAIVMKVNTINIYIIERVTSMYGLHVSKSITIC